MNHSLRCFLIDDKVDDKVNPGLVIGLVDLTILFVSAQPDPIYSLPALISTQKIRTQ